VTLFDAQTLIVLIVLGAPAALLAWSWPFQVMAVLVLLVPFRDLSIRWMNAGTDLSAAWVNAFSRWWYIMILALLGVVILQAALHWRKSGWTPRLRSLDALFGLILLVAMLYALVSPDLKAGITSLRGYLQPMAVFLLARAMRPTRQHLRILLALMLIVGALMAAFELWQFFGWSEADYRGHGYIRQNGELVAPPVWIQEREIIRPTSTVSGPNELGVDMIILSMLAGLAAVELRSRGCFAATGLALLFFVGLALTFSRSAFLGWLAALGFVLLFYMRRTAETDVRQALQRRSWVPLLTAALVALLGVAAYRLGTVELLRHTLQTFTQQYHIQDSLEAIRYLAANPGGVGMGFVEPKGAFYLMAIEGKYHVEGSLFQIAMEMGVWGLALWLAFWGSCLAVLWRAWDRVGDPTLRVFVGTAFASWVGALVAFVFLPLMQSVSLMVWLWFLLGLGVSAEAVEADWTASSYDAAGSGFGPVRKYLALWDAS